MGARSQHLPSNEANKLPGYTSVFKTFALENQSGKCEIFLAWHAAIASASKGWLVIVRYTAGRERRLDGGTPSPSDDRSAHFCGSRQNTRRAFV